MNALETSRLAMLVLGVACASRDAAPTDSAATAGAIATPAAVTSAAIDTGPARRLVQEFYDWYAPMAVSFSQAPGPQRDRQGPSWWQAMRPEHHLALPLLAALRSDSIARTSPRNHGDVLTSDPFLVSQDLCQPYRVSEVTARDSTAMVTVVAACPGMQNSQWTPPTAVVIVATHGPQLEIADVLDTGSSLVARICGAEPERARRCPPR